MKIIEKKILPNFLHAILDGSKRFEIRREDDPDNPVLLVGTVLHLRGFILEGYDDEYTPGYTGEECLVRITYRTDFEQAPGMWVLGISDPL